MSDELCGRTITRTSRVAYAKYTCEGREEEGGGRKWVLRE